MTVDERKIAKFENLKIEIYSGREEAGEAAAIAAAQALRKVAAVRESFGVIFATGAPKLATLNALSRTEQVPWAGFTDSTWMTT
jgi:6-phosphogluconolactonase/glucosamine-6-phosphate isomerase/deaminase